MSYFDDNEDRITGGYSRYAYSRQRRAARGCTEPANPPPVCDRCGKADLKWKWVDRWTLFEQDNQVHACSTASADDFDDCSDLV